MPTILIVDDDYAVRELLQFYLSREGYHFLAAEEGNTAIRAFQKNEVHLAIIDLMVPNIDGYQLCHEIKMNNRIPVLVLTANHSLTSRSKSYTSRADDYLTKPFEPKELLFRIKSLLQRFFVSDDNSITIGKTVINKKSYAVTDHGITVFLPLKEFELLYYLAKFPEETFTQEHLITHAWGSDFNGDKKTIDFQVQRLKERIGHRFHDFHIRAVPGLGYRLEIKE